MKYRDDQIATKVQGMGRLLPEPIQLPHSEVVIIENMRHAEGYMPVVIPLLKSFWERSLQ